MQDSRKQIIVNEIHYWKENRLIPEQYCDFLLALYTEGNVQEKTDKSSKKTVLFFLLLIPSAIFLFYFTELSLILQMVLAFIFVLVGIYCTYYLAKKGLIFQIPLICTAFIILFVSVEITLTYTSDHIFILYMVLGANCLLWLVTGIKLKQLYLSISGVAGLLLLVVSLFKSITFPFLT